MSKSSSELGLFVLVKWLQLEKPTLDVYPIKTIVNKELANEISGARDFSKFIGMESEVYYKRKPYPAKLMAFGTNEELEKKRKHMASQIIVDQTVTKKSRDPAVNKVIFLICEMQRRMTHSSNRSVYWQNQLLLNEINTEIQEAAGVSNLAVIEKETMNDSSNAREEKLLKKIQKLKRKNEILLEENEKLQKGAELDHLISKLRKVIQTCKESRIHSGNESEQEEMVDIGNNIWIKKSDLTRAEFSSSGNPRFFARNLLLCLFTEHELVNTSISGKQSNAFKDIPAKPQLDPVKINAILNYVKSKYDISLDKIKRTIQDKIKEVTNTNKKKSGMNETTRQEETIFGDVTLENANQPFI